MDKVLIITVKVRKELDVARFLEEVCDHFEDQDVTVVNIEDHQNVIVYEAI